MASSSESVASEIAALPAEVAQLIFTYTHHPAYDFKPMPFCKGGSVSAVEYHYIHRPSGMAWCFACGEQVGEDWVCCGATGEMMCQGCANLDRCLACEIAVRNKKAARLAANGEAPQ